MNKAIPPYIIIMIGVLINEAAGLFFIPVNIANYLRMVGSVIAIVYFFSAPKRQMPGEISTYLKFLYVIIFFMVMRGSIIGRFPMVSKNSFGTSIYDIIRYFLVERHSTLAILFPFVVMVDWNSDEFKYYVKFGLISSVLAIISFFFFKDYIGGADIFGYTSLIGANGNMVTTRTIANSIFYGFGMILCLSWSFSYFKDKWYFWIIPFILVLYFYCQVLGGGRGDSVSAFCYLLIFLYMLNKYKFGDMHLFSNKLIVFGVLAIGVAALYYLATNTAFFSLLLRRSFVDGSMNSEIMESSRENFTNLMITDFDSHPLCWVFGRGVNGYYSLGYGRFRDTIEWGFLRLILKGGILYLFLYVIVLIKTFLKGFRYSNNILGKSLAIMCLVQVLLLIPFGIPAVTIQFLLVWHSVRLLHSEDFLEMTDDEIFTLLRQK